jgi:metal-dependent amidase/aminoacylase/carboxypeptidase family protein
MLLHAASSKMMAFFLGNHYIAHHVHTLCLQALVSRETSPLGTAVVSVTKQAAGEGAYNVIPETASFGGTIRSLSHDHLMQLKRRIDEVTFTALTL